MSEPPAQHSPIKGKDHRRSAAGASRPCRPQHGQCSESLIDREPLSSCHCGIHSHSSSIQAAPAEWQLLSLVASPQSIHPKHVLAHTTTAPPRHLRLRTQPSLPPPYPCGFSYTRTPRPPHLQPCLGPLLLRTSTLQAADLPTQAKLYPCDWLQAGAFPDSGLEKIFPTSLPHPQVIPSTRTARSGKFFLNAPNPLLLLQCWPLPPPSQAPRLSHLLNLPARGHPDDTSDRSPPLRLFRWGLACCLLNAAQTGQGAVHRLLTDVKGPKEAVSTAIPQ